MVELYGLKAVPTFDIRLRDEDLAALRKHPREWLKADFEYAGQTFSDVAMRLKVLLHPRLDTCSEFQRGIEELFAAARRQPRLRPSQIGFSRDSVGFGHAVFL